MGHEAYVAHDGPECLEQVMRLKPSIVLLDGLPGMVGVVPVIGNSQVPIFQGIKTVSL
jgi:hypothetical protein